MAELTFKKVDENAVLPSYAHEGDSGMDLYSVEGLVIPAGEWRVVSTGLSAKIPVGHEVQVRSKSGLAAKSGISVLNSPGTIDESYLGTWKCIMKNSSKVDFKVKVGMKIAQAVIARVERVEIVEGDDLGESSRGENGFGSTGE